MDEKNTYKESMRRLKEIIDHIENEEPDVDELTSLVKEATKLITFCKNKLRDTEDDMKGLLDEI
jgi:exodeoxyribonuclease VII small subunit